MFTKAVRSNREAIYGLLCSSQVGPQQVNFSNGTAFMISTGICVTVAHVLHVGSDKTKPLHAKIEVIRCPDIGGQMKPARLIAEDTDRDIAILEIMNPSNTSIVTLSKSRISHGSSCGSLGFPLSNVTLLNNGPSFNLVERFQGAHISAFQSMMQPGGKTLDFYEIDSLMYGGSSGCPVFTTDGNVFGMLSATFTEGRQPSDAARLAISLLIPSRDIINFATRNNVSKLNMA